LAIILHLMPCEYICTPIRAGAGNTVGAGIEIVDA
jgi:hypothetical protein